MFWRVWPSQMQLRGIYSLLGTRVPAISLQEVLRVSVRLFATFPYRYIYGLYLYTPQSPAPVFFEMAFIRYYLHSVTCRNLCRTH
jgi:hypothetical protein